MFSRTVFGLLLIPVALSAEPTTTPVAKAELLAIDLKLIKHTDAGDTVIVKPHVVTRSGKKAEVHLDQGVGAGWFGSVMIAEDVKSEQQPSGQASGIVLKVKATANESGAYDLQLHADDRVEKKVSKEQTNCQMCSSSSKPTVKLGELYEMHFEGVHAEKYTLAVTVTKYKK